MINEGTALKKLIAAVLFAISSTAGAECVDGVWQGTWAGPSQEPPSCEMPVEPTPADPVLCFPEGCVPVTYSWYGQFRIAEATMPSGYPMLGWSGPCVSGNCPEIDAQAYWSLYWNSRQVYRSARY